MTYYNQYQNYNYKYLKLKIQLGGIKQEDKIKQENEFKAYDIKSIEHEKELIKYDKEFDNYQKKLIDNSILNSELLLFIINFISEQEGIQKIVKKNSKYINTIDNLEINTKTKEFKILLNDIIQWLLFNYDKEFFNILINLLINILYKFNFDKNINGAYIQSDNTKLNIIIYTIIDVIDKLKNESIKLDAVINTNITLKTTNQKLNEKKKNNNNNIILLQILLKLIVNNLLIISNFLLTINENYNKNKGIVLSKNIILCILHKILIMDIAQNEEIKKLISEIIINTTQFTNYKDQQFYINLIKYVNKVFSILKCSTVILENTIQSTGNTLKHFIGLK